MSDETALKILANGTPIRHANLQLDMTGTIADYTVDTSQTPPKIEYLITWDNEWYGPSDIIEVTGE